eukprot:tig00020592_g11635.t1
MTSAFSASSAALLTAVRSRLAQHAPANVSVRSQLQGSPAAGLLAYARGASCAPAVTSVRPRLSSTASLGGAHVSRSFFVGSAGKGPLSPAFPRHTAPPAAAVRHASTAAAPALVASMGAFTPLQSLAGALLLGSGVFVLMLMNGRVAGISGTFATVVFGDKDAWRLRACVLAGMAAGAWLGKLLYPAGFVPLLAFPTWQYILGGLLVGWGTQTANGCTSGHMICGISRLSLRSIASSATFMGVAAAVANGLHRNWQGAQGIAPYAAASAADALAMGGALVAVAALGRLVVSLSPRDKGTLSEETSGLASSLLSGVAIGAGLAFSGMGRQDAVLGFLNFMDVWNPSLLFVAGGALLPNLILYFWLIRGMPRPLFGDKFCVPSPEAQRKIDAKLLAGSVAFGAGWGLIGLCPGPALINAAVLEPTALLFVACMTAGMALARYLPVFMTA